MKDKELSFQLVEFDLGTGGLRTVQAWADWDGFMGFAKERLYALDGAYLQVQQGERQVTHYAPRALFEGLYQYGLTGFFAGEELLQSSSLPELHHDSGYAQSYGRWLIQHQLHDFTLSEQQSNWLVANGAAVALWPMSALSVEHLSTDGVELVQVCGRLDDLDHKLEQERGFATTAGELTDFLRHSVQHLLQSLSLSEGRDLIPDRFQGRFAELDATALAQMRDYVLERYQHTSYKTLDSDGNSIAEEFFVGEGMPSPMEEQPLRLSAADWHQLCGIQSELIQHGEVPRAVLNDRDFWFPLEDLIGKGDNLMGDERYGERFDEIEVFSAMPDRIRNTVEVAEVLLQRGILPVDQFDQEVVRQACLRFEPENYPLIPEALRERPEFAEVADRAVAYSPYLVLKVPDNQLTVPMLRETIGCDFSLLRRFPTSFLQGVPGIEELLVDTLRHFDRQTFMQPAVGYADEGSVALDLELAKADALSHVPESLRSKRVCQEAVRLHAANEQYVPVGVSLREEPMRAVASRMRR